MSRPTHNSTYKSQSFFSNESDHITNSSCKKCKGSHSLRQCEQFKALSVNDRIKFLFQIKFVSTAYRHPISNTIAPAKEDVVNGRRDITLFYFFNQGIRTYQILQHKFKRMLIQNQSSRLQL